MQKLNLKIITPERIIYDGQVQSVILPTLDGQVGILANHIPYMAPLRADELIIHQEGDAKNPEDTVSLAIDFGLAEFVDNQLLVLVAQASSAEEIDLQMAEQARARAQEVMSQDVDQEEYTNALALFERESAKIKVAHKYRLKRGLA